MSKAIFCDRCGILFPEHNIHRIELCEILPIVDKCATSYQRGKLLKNGMASMICGFNLNEVCETTINLCSNCVEAVTKFFNEAQEIENET